MRFEPFDLVRAFPQFDCVAVHKLLGALPCIGLVRTQQINAVHDVAITANDESSLFLRHCRARPRADFFRKNSPTKTNRQSQKAISSLPDKLPSFAAARQMCRRNA